MVKEYSPFTPGVPVPLEFFVGRAEEITQFVEGIKRSIALGRAERFFIIGERGIGKSSICRFVQWVAERDQQILGLHVFNGGVDSLEEMVRRIFERLLRESLDKPWHAKIKNFLGNHIKQLDIFGLSVEFSASERDLSRAVNDFVPSLRNLLGQLKGEKKGILIILDDINGLASSAQFANWFKSTVDEIATTSDPLPVTFVLVGLPERRNQLVSLQPSLNRVFELIEIRRFSQQETRDFFQRTFSKVSVEINEEALTLLCRYSGGYPVFMHELGDAVFKADTDNHIDRKDAVAGIFRAAEVIGVKYVEPQITAAIRSEKYQGILKKLAREPFEHRFIRKDIVSQLTATEAKVFDNFLRRMEGLGAIRKDKERGPGSYEFTSEIHHLFFWLQASAQR
jgi:AAA+ ATPase superfamily predicted ATPase